MASGSPHSKGRQLCSLDLEHVQLNMNWDDVLCPICLDSPHNAVLIYCTSYEKGCRPFMCDTGCTHSNCLNRFKHANGMPEAENVPSTSHAEPDGSMSVAVHANVRPACPLCRGEVTGWVVINEARKLLNEKQRCCEEEQCKYVGNYLELLRHAEQSHPHARPSEIDPARQLDWENFQQSSELVDVLSTIHSEVPHAVVLGDYIIEYGEDDRTVDYEDFPGDDGNWWTSCILYQVFDNLRASRNRRRSRTSQARSETRSGRQHSRYDSSDIDDSSVTSMDISEYRMDETDDEFGSRGVGTRRSSGHRRLG
ncbi:hypothetical protein ACLOJK_036778 [Asimina triloba]